MQQLESLDFLGRLYMRSTTEVSPVSLRVNRNWFVGIDRFNLYKIFRNKSVFARKVIKETVFNYWADGNLRTRKKVLDGLRHQMCATVTNGFKFGRIFVRNHLRKYLNLPFPVRSWQDPKKGTMHIGMMPDFKPIISLKIGTGGFEPPTPCMSSKYSTPELRA